MQYTKLPHSTLEVSKICLGTMTFGEQNSQQQAFEQLDYALDQGVNFIDTAEMYPVPPNGKTQGLTESYIGNWLEKSGKREKVVLATKVAGPRNVPHIREKMSLDRRNIHLAIDDSLRRLKTDYVDLYQLHWPNRGVNVFGTRDFPLATAKSEVENYEEILETLNDLVKQGKIKTYGLSNETPWGTMKYMEAAKKLNVAKPVTVQNSYSLIHRGYEVGMSEVSMRENIGLLAYSPLAQGVLSGKYLDGNKPKGARGTLFPRFIARYMGDGSLDAVRKYEAIAKNNGMTLSELSLAFVNQLPFVTSNIIGATKMSQLKENIGSIHINLPEETLKEIEEVHAAIPNPAP